MPLLLLLVACVGGTDPAPAPAAPTTGFTEAERTQLARFRLPTSLAPDPSNRWADDPAAAALGRELFYDPDLSPSGRFACATCHDPAKHFSDGLPKAVGAGTTARHAPTIEGSQAGPWFFWDGRVDSLWAQAAGPIESAVEMDSDRLHVAHHVLDAHRDAYAKVFGEVPDLSDGARFPARGRPDPKDPTGPLATAWDGMAPEDREVVTGVFVRAVKAIAAFERTLLPGEAPLDRYVDAVLAGDASGGGALSPEAERGLRLFLRDANCVACHHGPFLTDHAFHTLGLPEAVYDPGRIVGATLVQSSELRCGTPWSDATSCDELRFLAPGFEDFRGAFKTPSLRNVTATAPYMHHGELADLDAVLQFYTDLPGTLSIGHRELTLQPLHLTAAQKAELKAFLAALEAPVRPDGLPPAGLHASR